MAVKRYYDADKVDELLARYTAILIMEIDKEFDSPTNEYRKYTLAGANCAAEYLKTRLGETSVKIRIKD